MNRIGRREIAHDAARLFENEVRELKSEIPRDELCAMVDDYVYYQTDDMSRQEARAVVDETCRAMRKG